MNRFASGLVVTLAVALTGFALGGPREAASPSRSAASPSRSAASPSRSAASPSRPASGLAARIERMAYAMLPKEKLNRALGFFGPVTKRYLPVFNRFHRDYNRAEKKMPVIVRYLPQAEKALAEAKAMKVPAKYEAEKANYIKMAEAFVAALRLSAKFAEDTP